MSGKRFSPLKQVNTNTVKNLSLKWVTTLTTGCGPTGTAPAAAGGRAAAVAAADAAAAAAPAGADHRRRSGQRRREQLRPRAPRRRHPVRRRRHLRVVAVQRLRDRRARRDDALALLLEDARRHQPADARPRHVAQLHLLRAARRLGRLPRREDRQGSLAARDRAVRSAVLLVERADGHQATTCSSAPATTSTRRRS